MKETIGIVLGWLVVTIVAWLAALLIMGYSLASLDPFTWSIEERSIHLIIQLAMIGAYMAYIRPRNP